MRTRLSASGGDSTEKRRGDAAPARALYGLASNPATYANEYYDVNHTQHQADPDVPGYTNTPGWDPVTGLGTPNAASLLPDLAAHTLTH